MGNVAPQPAPVPHFVGRYEVLVPIASGGMATVYLARSRGAGGFEREVALKLTHAHLRDSQEFQTLLVEEAKLASSIRHHNVVCVLDVGDDPLGLFLVMDYVEGDTLSGLIRRARAASEIVPRPIAMRALLDALAGLHAAHETKDPSGQPLHLVHRDFSPQNILVGTDGVSKLTDFGIAKAASRAGHTSTGVLKGKIAYMSPEQARGLALDRRADIWAAGVLAWEIVTGHPLWPRDQEDVSTLIKLVTEPPRTLRSVDPEISEALDQAVSKALAMDPNERWPTAAAFAKALASAVERAEPEDVAEYVRKSAGPKIEQRREQIRAMGRLRAQIGEITEASQMTPSGNYPRAPAPVPAPGEPQLSSQTPPDADTTEVVSGAVYASPASPPLPPAPVAHDFAPRKKTPPPWAIPVVVGAVALGAMVMVVAALVRSHHDETPPTSRPQIETATTGIVVATPSAASTPEIPTAATTAQPPPTTTTPTLTSKPVVRSPPVVNHVAEQQPTAKPATPPMGKIKLAPSPY